MGYSRHVVGRRLAAMERAFVLLDEVLPFNGVLVLRLRGPLDEASLRRGIAALQARHPLLRMAIDGDRFVELAEPMPLRTVPRDGDDRWRAEAEHVLNERFAPGGLLARLVWVRGDGVHELLTAHHHVIADAQSSVYLAQDLLPRSTRPSAARRWTSRRCPCAPPSPTSCRSVCAAATCWAR
jgi:hypothetical protein